PRRIALGNHAQPFAKTIASGQHAVGVELAHFVVEQLVLIGERSGETAGVRLRQIGQHFGEQLESDQEAVQRVFVEIVAAPENIFEQLSILLEIPKQQAFGELSLK